MLDPKTTSVADANCCAGFEDNSTSVASVSGYRRITHAMIARQTLWQNRSNLSLSCIRVVRSHAPNRPPIGYKPVKTISFYLSLKGAEHLGMQR